MRIPCDLRTPYVGRLPQPVTDYTVELKGTVTKTHEVARRNLRESHRQQKKYYDKKAHGSPREVAHNRLDNVGSDLQMVCPYRNLNKNATPCDAGHVHDNTSRISAHLTLGRHLDENRTLVGIIVIGFEIPGIQTETFKSNVEETILIHDHCMWQNEVFIDPCN
ncbi:hypothetical protein FGIG_06898 [Fasciola gigantica]|uniref:Uncharacterized protein n=1 Tax=Fasciola gigantica TaxID=46835 RepID=A0A504YYT5_FASGI|nr:hypothetical protein FGIG_06898 [Fasciola gigantica]